MAAVGAIGALAGGVMGMMQANYQAEVAKMNEEVAKDNARRATQRGGIQAQEQDAQTAALLGEQEVAQAASGVTLSGKSQILTRNTARLFGRRDAENIISDSRMERYNHLVQAANYKAEAQAAKMSGMASMVGGVLGAAGAMTGSASSSMMGGAQSTTSPVRSVPKPATVKPIVTSKPFVAPVKNFAVPRTANPLLKKTNGLLGAI